MTPSFFKQLDDRIAQYDLLCHPFYKAWSSGQLTRDDLREYACDYYPHVESFPTYLAELAGRLEEGELRRAVLANLSDEQGGPDPFQPLVRAHSELWLDFAEGMGADRKMQGRKPVAEVQELVRHFSRVAREGSAEEALAAFYAYESQVPRVAREKARGLRQLYAVEQKSCEYFTLHSTADVHHSAVWRQQLGKRVQADPRIAEAALNAAEETARQLWCALDGIERHRQVRAAA